MAGTFTVPGKTWLRLILPLELKDGILGSGKKE